ncbi:COG6 [Acrasis kona]|uniref:Conserved oligomeric Golgi complex subunit 6 n=1 Tax=Acrasis kona TaxID=1008807 RepID=A0AAW2YJ28_9EUKA
MVNQRNQRPLLTLDTKQKINENGGGSSPSTTAPQNSIITRKVHQVVSISSSLAENDSLRNALQYLGTFYGENTVDERRNLRGVLESKTLDTHKELLREFTKVNERLELLDNVVGDLSKACSLIDEQMRQHESVTKSFLVQYNNTQQKLSDSQHRQKLISTFLTQFQLTDAERDALLYHPITQTFFRTLNKVHDIKNACTDMLRTHQQKSGLEIMEEMSGYQDTAYERLSRWTQEKCRLLSSDVYQDSYADEHDEHLYGHLLVEQELKNALNALSGRPVLLRCCLKEIVSARKTALVSKFFDALHGGRRRPIEMAAHDPVRYIGDILAWIHQSAASERELVDSLLSNDESEPGTPTSSSSSSLQSYSFGVLDETFQVLNAHLKDKIDQILNGERVDMIVYFRLGHLMELYRFTIGKLLGMNSSLPCYLSELRSMVDHCFYDVLQKQQVVVSLTLNLKPPNDMVDLMHKLTDILNTLNQSMVPQESREQEFSNIISAVVDPILSNLSSTITSQENISDMYVFIVNCHALLHNTLSPYDFATKKSEVVMAETDKIMEQFISFQSDQLLTNVGIKQILDLIKNNQKPLSAVDGLKPEQMSLFMQSLYVHLFSTSTLLLSPQQQCDKISSTRLKVYSKNRITTALSDAYAQVYACIQDLENQYDNAKEIAFRTPQQVKILLE